MCNDPTPVPELVQRAAAGDQTALAAVLSEHRDRLKHMVQLRLNRRLQGRVDSSDVVQEALLEISQRLPEYVQAPNLPFRLWVRQITGRKLIDVHRHHLGAQRRDAGREVAIPCHGLPEVDSDFLANHLAANLTSPSQAAMKAEVRRCLQDALARMDAVDREVLTLKHFEQFTTSEIALELGLSKAGAGSRYLRAITRLHNILSQFPGLNAL